MLIALSTLLTACGRAAPTPSAALRTSPDTPTTTVATPMAEATPAPTHTLPHPYIPTPPSQPGPLPLVIATITLAEPPAVCAGSALAVDQASGYLHTAGTRDGEPCLTVIDPATGQVRETHVLPFDPRFLLWDGGTLYALGQDGDELVVADAHTGQTVAREPFNYAQGGPFGGELSEARAVARDGWIYVGLPGDPALGGGSLHLIPLQGGTALIIADVTAFDLASDGRFAVVGGQETTTVRVYAGASGDLLAEREIGPGEPGMSVAFDGQADRIFVSLQQPEGDASSVRHFVFVLDATSLESVNLIEEQAWMLTADPHRGYVYAYAHKSRILKFDAATGRLLSTPFNIPQPAEGFSTIRPWEKLRVDPATGRVYTIYQDFDLSTWTAGFDPATSAGGADVPVPPGAPWVLDAAHGRLYFAGRSFLLALNPVTLQPVHRMALSRKPVSAAVAPDHGTLFVGDEGGDVHVLDLQTHDGVRVLAGVGGYVDVDTTHGWLYAGDEFAAGISVYDLATLERRGIIAQPGRPSASPADGQVYILEEDVYRGDGATLTVLEGRTARNAGCNGCAQPTGVAVDPRSGQAHVTTYSTWVGKPGPASHVALDPLTGRAFVARTTGGYRVIYTLATYADLTLEQPLAWRDGLYGQPLYNPTTDHLYLTDGSRLLVLDGETLDLIGWMYPSDERDEELAPAAVDVHRGRAYLLAGQQVLVLGGTGGWPETVPPQPIAHLPGPPEGILPLPDGTLFVRAYEREGYTSRLYRSSDGGQTWEEVRGGLPGAPNDLALAPDSTLYAAAVPTAWQAETEEASWGEGIYRSDDGGDTWTPFSQGLAHLRVSRVHANANGEVYLLAAGTWPEQQNWPVPSIWQLGGNGRWSPVEVPEAGPFTSPGGAVPYTYTQAIRVAWHTLSGGGELYRSWGGDLQRSADGGLAWETIASGPAEYGVGVLTGAGDPPTLYWRTWEALYRSTDGGTSWNWLSHPSLAESAPSAIAVAEIDGEEMLFVGTEAGELLALSAAEADWRPGEAPDRGP
jgi:DNA-binding beta-propeller fold protein YncE